MTQYQRLYIIKLNSYHLIIPNFQMRMLCLETTLSLSRTWRYDRATTPMRGSNLWDKIFSTC